MVLNVTEQRDFPKLSQVLFDRRKNTFATLAALPSNVEAIEAGLLFCTGLTTFTAIVGPSGWGKSHLLDAIAHRFEDADRNVRPLTLDAFLNNPGRYETARVLILDDVQDVIGKTRRRQELRLHLERRVRSGKGTVLAFTAPKASRNIKLLLPMQREWTIASITAPAAEERVLLLNQMSAAEGLSLSPQLVKIVAHKMHGNGRTLSGALKRLRLASNTWVTPEETLRACGMLDPFFSDNCDWDLRLKILRAADVHSGMYWKTNATDLALYTMLCVGGLSESEVARAAHVEPAEAYTRAARFKKLLNENADIAASSRHFVEIVVSSLTQD